MKIGWVLRTAERGLNGYAEVRDMAQRVEAEGLDSIWLYDHLLYQQNDGSRSGIWESWTILSALAEATGRVELGTLVLCTQFRNPALLAKMASTLDEVSAGRLILGLGAGWNEPEFRAFGFPYDHRVSRFEEAVQIIKPLLREGRVDFVGSYYQARECEIRPRGPRPAGPPILIAGQGPRMLRLTAQYADSWNTSYMEPFLESRAKLHAACTDVGRDPASIEITVEIALDFPDIGNAPSSRVKYILSGSTEEIASEIYRYDRLGVGHLMFRCSPSNPVALARLIEAVKLYRTLPA